MARWIKTLALAGAVVIAPVLPVSLAQAPTAVPPKPAEAKPADQMANGISLSAAWARATPGGARIGAAFLDISAAAGVEDKLVGASSPIAQAVELHDHIREGGIVKMRRIESDRPVIACDRQVELALVGTGDPAIVIGERMARIERDRRVEIADRAIEVALGLVAVAAIVVDIGVPRVEIDRGAEVADRLIVVALVEIFEAAIEIGDGEGADIIGARLDDGAAGPEARLPPELLAIMPVIRAGHALRQNQRDEENGQRST